MSEKEAQAREMFKWSVRLQNEAECSKIQYIMNVNWLNLMNLLTKTQGNLIKVVGAQGVGKTAFCNWLNFMLNMYSSTGKPGTDKRRIRKGDEVFGFIDKIYDDWVWDYSDDLKNLLVDLWDYSKNKEKDIIKALDAIQSYWLHRCERFEDDNVPLPNIVVFLQKESLPLHFFLGKMQFFELPPWNPKILASYPESAFGSSEPFTKEALLEIARVSRGIFRKFKEYISVCLNDYFMNKDSGKITIADVKRVITSEKIVRDMELALSEIFPRSKENRVTSIHILAFLREQGPTEQKVLNDKFFLGNPMGCSRILKKLEMFGYVEHEQKGRERRWKILE